MPLLAEAMASTIPYRVSPKFSFSFENKSRSRVRFRASGSDSTGFSDSVAVNGASSLRREKTQNGVVIEEGNGRLVSKVEEIKKEKVKSVAGEGLEVLWDDGYGSITVKDYLNASKEIIKPDGGPPRWFSPIASGKPPKDSPVLFFLPGLDGTGMGLILHEKALGKAFEVRCLHIPVNDRTPFEGLVRFVEETVRQEHTLSPNKPIYLVGDSFGGCLALSVAARNPTIDIVLILSNPATSFGRSQLQPIFPILEALPDELHPTVPYLLSLVMGDPLKMATVDIETALPPTLRLAQLSKNLTDLLPLLSGLADIIPKDALIWKLKLLRSAAFYANSRLHAVRAEVLVLASGKDNMLPSQEEAQRLKRSLQNCKVRFFGDNGHTLLLEESLSLLTVIRGTGSYRRSRRIDYVSDYLPPSMTDLNRFLFNGFWGLLHFAFSSVMFSTLEDGKIVRGLQGVPDEGPVLLVGYHVLAGLELFSLVEEFLREKKILVRGLAHPFLFTENRIFSNDFSINDWMKVFGAVPVNGSNIFKLLSTKSHVLLYPGGVREALHNKGEAYKLFWPDKPEFVRMAARFEATIVPFAAVGEDDLVDFVLDSEDISKIPVLNNLVKEANHNTVRVRDEQEVIAPILSPKVPGRLYYLFGKPIRTKGMKETLKDKDNANQLYMKIKSDIEHCISYLIKKREEDPYRNIVDRTVYQASHAPLNDVPSFEP